jgi:hypothetical protein
MVQQSPQGDCTRPARSQTQDKEDVILALEPRIHHPYTRSTPQCALEEHLRWRRDKRGEGSCGADVHRHCCAQTYKGVFGNDSIAPSIAMGGDVEGYP